jgi:hypothetical protein
VNTTKLPSEVGPPPTKCLNRGILSKPVRSEPGGYRSAVTDWPTIASLSTAGGTLVLAVATFTSVRSANRAARAAEASLLEGLRPLLVPSHLEDPPEKVGFQDEHWVRVAGGGGTAEVSDEAIYLTMSLRNVGRGIAVLDRWFVHPEHAGVAEHESPERFRRLTRDLYIAPSDRGFWQGALRDPSDPIFTQVRETIEAHRPLTIDLLYSDYEGGQRVISRFSFRPMRESDWILAASRHWNLDRAEPR